MLMCFYLHFHVCQMLGLRENLRLFGLFIVILVVLDYDLVAKTKVEAWTYHYSTSPSRDWNSARQFCRQHYTDMVAIQNQKEITYLNEILPRNPKYYWIGIRKVGDVWTWIGTNKTVTKESENWAAGEPNNGGSQEDCVEIYIKRPAETAKWNDEKCTKDKGTICYNASCSPHACSSYGECVETIGNYTCSCHPGFQGPRCEEAQRCRMLTAPPHGNLSCSHPHGNFSFNSSCDVRCEEGYFLNGTVSTRCASLGTWTETTGMCQVVRCKVLTPPRHGSMHCNHPLEEFSYSSTCWLGCEEGFILKGANSTQCTSRGVWSSTSAVCEAQRCRMLTAPPHGNLSCSHPHGNFSFNSSCDVRCEEGYFLNGTVSTRCASLGTWTETTGMCQVVRCKVLTPPRHGSMHCNHPLEEFSYSSTCRLGCEEGFILKGANSTQCTSRGVWSSTSAVCEAQRCRMLTAPPHGNLSCSHPHGNFSFNSSCDVRCEEGYFLNGTASTWCASLGMWTETTGMCQVVRCKVLTPPRHGSMHCNHPLEEFSYSSTCWLGCEEGFILKGANSTQCTSRGVWSSTSAVCEAQRCRMLTAPPHGNLSCSHPHGNFSFNSSCDVRCEEGYFLNGTVSTRCASLGTWTETTGMCQVVRCKVLTPPRHGSMHCNHPLKEFSYSSTCWLGCEEGFILKGANSTQCTSQGVWSSTSAVCEAQRCRMLTAPPHGNLSCSHPHGNFSFNSSCDVRCEEGYFLNGTVSTRCASLGTWKETTGMCQVVRCKVLTPPRHGSMHCNHPLEEFSYSSTCWLGCEEGFILKGANSTQCTSRGVWSSTSAVCEAQRCRMLTVPPHGNLSCSHPHGNFSFNSSCDVRCEEGYFLNGTASTWCASLGTWTETTGMCQVVRCKVLTPPRHGSMHCNHPLEEFSYSSTCWLGCEEGFILKGANSTQCTSRGVWSSTSAVCEARQCRPLEVPSHGHMTCTHPHSHFSFGSRCELGCEEGFLLRGPHLLQCTTSGLWSNVTPSCQAVQCSPQEVSPPLSMNCSHPLGISSFQSQCHFHCGEGFMLNGTEYMSCTSQGLWTNPSPSCRVREMSMGARMLMYMGLGSATSIGLLLMGALLFYTATHLKEKGGTKELVESLWLDQENPAFENS
ncbi:P-selectin-like isoform X1 [Brienomyrus brachyistius]|uniref:P-selectin-like isoform X1 n=1 Tax=Brienomyrus brachyistius TaxID=42636 RepID=UPI0020B2C37D|nr:P-selectin-like isoform X1 [Brienomyrus brachyistius]